MTEEKKGRKGGEKDPMRQVSEGRSDLFSFDPDKLVIITDPKHALYDERASLPVEEAMILNVMAYGVIQPIVFRTEENDDGETIAVVVAGRQRVKAAREANKRLKAKGELPLRVPGVRRRENDHGTIGAMVSENEVRKGDDMLIKAAKARRMMEQYGYSEEKCAMTFGVSVATLRRYLAIEDATPDVKEAFVKGELPAGAAVELAKLPKAKQAEAVANLRDKGKVGKKAHQGANEAAKQAAKAGGAPPVKERQHLRSIKHVRSIMDALQDGEPHVADRVQHETITTVLRWVLGEDDHAPLASILEGMQYTFPEKAKDKLPRPPLRGPLPVDLARLPAKGQRRPQRSRKCGRNERVSWVVCVSLPPSCPSLGAWSGPSARAPSPWRTASSWQRRARGG